MAADYKRQLEQIMDASTGQELNVIVRVQNPGKVEQKVLKSVSDVMKRRGMAQTARELEPPARGDAVRKSGVKLSSTQKRELRKHSLSLVSQVAPVISVLSGAATLEPLLALGIAAYKEVVNSIRKSRSSPIVSELWIAKSVAIRAKRDALPGLLDEMEPSVYSVYPNRTLRVPPVAEVKVTAEEEAENRTGSWGLRQIGAFSAWGAYGTRGNGVKIGLLDTGIDPNHPDLAGKVADWAEFDSLGGSVAGSQPHDSGEHGTHCAGILVGENQSGRWIGVAPKAELSVALVLDGKNGGTDAQVLAGIQWALQQNVQVISMSLGGLTLGPEVPDYYTDAILSCALSGVPLVAAIGNSGHQTTGAPGNDLLSFSVGATDSKDRIAGFSGGKTHIVNQSSYLPPDMLPLAYSKPDVSAPGVAVESSVPGGNYATWNGTSMATPYVAGALALLLGATSIGTDVTEGERSFLLQDLLISSTKELGESGKDQRYGYGRIDVLRAIALALEKGY